MKKNLTNYYAKIWLAVFLIWEVVTFVEFAKKWKSSLMTVCNHSKDHYTIKNAYH